MAQARTRGEKLRRKRGRALLPAVEREPNGKKSRRQASKQEQENEMQAAAIATAKAQRVKLGVPESIALDPRLGYELGRLFIFRVVHKQRQLEAGQRYAQDMARYYGLTGIGFPSARAQNLFNVRGHDGDIDSRAEAAKAARAKMAALRDVLLSTDDIQTGRNVLRIVNAVVVEDVPCMPGWERWLLRGLNRLANHYGIQES